MKARAIADVTEGVILARVEIAVPPERVWKAITTEELANWWGAEGMYRTTKHTVDLRPGGAYRSDGSGQNGPFHVSGTILEVDPPKRLVQTWQPSWSTAAPTTITWLLEVIPTGTRLTLRHAGFTDAGDCDNHAQGWERVLSWLHAYAAPPLKHFLSRLVPPRPTFIQDASSDERAMMATHAQYWRGKISEGSAIALGPVGGPHGGFGFGLFAAPDEAALLAMQADDPAIKANAGFTYENSPVLSLLM